MRVQRVLVAMLATVALSFGLTAATVSPSEAYGYKPTVCASTVGLEAITVSLAIDKNGIRYAWVPISNGLCVGGWSPDYNGFSSSAFDAFYVPPNRCIRHTMFDGNTHLGTWYWGGEATGRWIVGVASSTRSLLAWC